MRLSPHKLHAKDLASKSALHEWHNKRFNRRAAPSADPDAPGPEILCARANGLKNSIEKVMNDHKVEPAGKSSVVAAELVLTANAKHFGGPGVQNWDPVKVQEFKDATMKFLEAKFGDMLAEVIFHADETAPHIHAYIVPIVKHSCKEKFSANGRKARLKNGQLKVGGRDYFTRRNLIEWQDGFGLAVEPLGLLRGERGSKAKHKEMRNAQRDLEIALARAKAEVERLDKLATQNAEMNRELVAEKREVMDLYAKLEVASKNLKHNKQAFKKRFDELAVQKTNHEQAQEEFEAEKKRVAEEKRKVQQEQSNLRAIPIKLLAEQLGFSDDIHGNYSIMGPHEIGSNPDATYRVLFEREKFRIEWLRHQLGGPKWESYGSGKGAIDFIKALFKDKLTTPQACAKLAEMFPDHKGGIVLELLNTQGPEMWVDLTAEEVPSAKAGIEPKPRDANLLPPPNSKGPSKPGNQDLKSV